MANPHEFNFRMLAYCDDASSADHCAELEINDIYGTYCIAILLYLLKLLLISGY